MTAIEANEHVHTLASLERHGNQQQRYLSHKPIESAKQLMPNE
jgi:hypothetical protein